MADDIILKGLKAYSVVEAEDKAMILQKYLDEILLFNPVLKLVGEKDREEIIYRHILDSASSYPVFSSLTKKGDKIADLGSGSGLPGVVLAILFPDRNFTLIDRMTRRIGFLRGVKAKLDLKNVEIIAQDISTVEDHFDCVTSRAFRPLSLVVEDMVKLAPEAILYKGTKKNINEELDELRAMGYTFSSSIYPVTSIGEKGERNIVVVNSWRKA